MKIKIFTLFGALALGVVSSMAQLSWMYDGETLEDGATVTMNGDAKLGDFVVGCTIDVYNASDKTVNCVVRRSNVVPEGSAFGMCTDNCVNRDESEQFSIEPNSTYKNQIGKGFHINNLSLNEPGEASATFTVTDGTNEAVLNLKFVSDEDPSNNGVSISSPSGVGNVVASGYNATLRGGTLVLSGVVGGSQVRVIDLTGRTVASYAVETDGVQRYGIGLTKGIYLVAIYENGQNVYTQKVIAR